MEVTMKGAIILLTLAIMFSMVLGHNVESGLSDRLEDIITEGWRRYKTRNDVDADDLLTAPLPAHECVHDSQYIHDKCTGDAKTNSLCNRHFKNYAGYACYTAGETITLSSGDSYVCQPEDVVSNDVRDFVTKDVIPTITALFESFLLVTPVATLKAAGCDLRVCQEGITTPDSLTNGVANKDFYIVFTVRPAENANTFATAVSCCLDSTAMGVDKDRPIVGVVHFSPRWFRGKPKSEYSYRQLIRVGAHELTHALGFSASLYEHFRDPATGNTYPTTGPGAAIQRRAGDDAPLCVSTASVLDYARKHFGCPSLDCFRLETDGGSGTAGSHWEQQDVGEEYMAGVANMPMVMSPLTLGFLQDMGWYTVDLSLGEDFAWGYKQGCSFLSTSCSSASWPYTCSGSSLGCSPNRYSFGPCQAGYATTPNCAWARGPIHCQNKSESQNPTIGDFYCDQCRCFEIDSLIEPISTPVACYQVRCSDDRKTLEVQVNGDWLKCSPGGKVSKRIDVFEIEVKCPADVSEICGLNVIDSSRLEEFTEADHDDWFLTKNGLLFWGTIALIALAILGITLMILCCCCDCFCGKR